MHKTKSLFQQLQEVGIKKYENYQKILRNRIMDKNALTTNDGWLYVDDVEHNVDITGLDAFNIFQEILLKARQKKDVFKGLRKEFADKIQQNICPECGRYTENDEGCDNCNTIERDSLIEQKYDSENI